MAKSKQTYSPDELQQRITPELLEQSAIEFRRELIQQPLEVLRDETLKYITLLPGVRNAVVFGELSGDAELAPYSAHREDNADYQIVGRTLQVHPGNCTKDFDPMEVFQSIYGSHLETGDTPSDQSLAWEVLALLTARIGKNLNDVVFTAVRNVDGNKTKDLFDGFITIVKKEKVLGNISVAKKNLYKMPAKITASNAVDLLRDFYESLDPELQKQDTFMYLDPRIYRLYLRDYQARNGALPYNTDYKKLTLEASFGKCTFAPLNNLAGTDHILVTRKQNLLLGTDIDSQENKAAVKNYKPWIYTFLFAGVYGAQIRSIAPETFCAAELVMDDEQTPTIDGASEITAKPQGGSMVRTYAASNGADVTAQTDADWLEVTPNGKKVTFVADAFAHDAQAEETERTATVVVGIEGTDVTMNVTVTQQMQSE